MYDDDFWYDDDLWYDKMGDVDLGPPGMVEERPDFGPNQVRSPEELEVEKTYVKHYRTGGNTRIVFLGLQNPRKFRYRYANPTYFKEEFTGSLADSGVIPYEESGLWNATNWLEKVED